MESINFLELERLEPMIIRSVTGSSILFFRIRENVVGRKSSKFSRTLVSWKWCCNFKLLNENGQPKPYKQSQKSKSHEKSTEETRWIWNVKNFSMKNYFKEYEKNEKDASLHQTQSRFIENSNFLNVKKLEQTIRYPPVLQHFISPAVISPNNNNVVENHRTFQELLYVSWKFENDAAISNCWTKMDNHYAKYFFFCWFMFIDNFILISHCLMRVLHVKTLFSYKMHTAQNLI